MKWQTIVLWNFSPLNKSVISCLFYSTIDGRIDQVNQVLELTRGAEGAARYTALDRWTNQLQYLQSVIVTKMNWGDMEPKQQ